MTGRFNNKWRWKKPTGKLARVAILILEKALKSNKSGCILLKHGVHIAQNDYLSA